MAEEFHVEEGTAKRPPCRLRLSAERVAPGNQSGCAIFVIAEDTVLSFFRVN